MSFIQHHNTWLSASEIITCTWKYSSTILLQMTSSLALLKLWRASPTMVKVATVALWEIPSITSILSWGCSIGLGNFLPPILLLVIVVVSVAVVVVVVGGVSLVIFPFSFVAFTNSSSLTLNCLLNQFTGHVDGIMQSCRLRRSDVSFDSFRKPTSVPFNLLLFSGHQFRTHQGQLMETIVVFLNVVSFQSQRLELLLYPFDFSCWAVFHSHCHLEFSPWNMVSIDDP
ncbi:hypothetical protein Tco_0988665 [Tanacetum coccineum]|uniref:Uncharacterized protein n=1 Tax=Tanacetum coccineum TaxID=301880 RepID=A0ABQ5ERJ7_9ASTR